MLRQVGETFELPLGQDLIESYARNWGASKRDYVLIEEVELWLKDNDIDAAIRHIGGRCEYDFIEYFLIFKTYPDAFQFLIRWS